LHAITLSQALAGGARVEVLLADICSYARLDNTIEFSRLPAELYI
jgi:hypothetical protein